MRKKRGIASDRGVTLTELVVTSAVGLLVAGAIFYFVAFAGSGTGQISARQQLEQESAIISELFMRNIRNGGFICVNTDTAAPGSDIDNVSKITIRAADKSVVATFSIAGDTLLMNGSRYLTSYLCNFKTPASHFKVFQNGKHAEFFLSLYKTIGGGDTINYTQTIGDVRCKN